jgi:hypothetical protein
VTAELTVAEVLTREGRPWPPADPDREPRHELVEAEPGDLLTFWADALAPREYVPPVAGGCCAGDNDGVGCVCAIGCACTCGGCYCSI